MAQSFPIGQAPWETGSSVSNSSVQPSTPQSFPVGQAPWEQPPKLGQGVFQGAGNILKGIASGPATLMSRPGELAGVGIAGLASKLTGNPDYYNRATDALNKPSAGNIIKPINQETPESIAGEGLSTVSPALGGIGSPTLGGALAGASGAGGQAMQNNGSPLNVLGNATLGGLIGGGVGSLQGSVASKINKPTLDDQLWTSRAVSTQPESEQIQATLSNNGISSLLTKEDIADAKNALFNSLRDVNNQTHSVSSLDPISGEPTAQAAWLTKQASALQDALRAVTQVGHHVNAGGLLRIGGLGAGTLGLGVGLGNLGSDTIKNAGKFLYDQFIGPPPSITK